MVDANKYSYRVVWSKMDQRFKGLCTEFSSLSRLADSPVSALQGIIEAVEETMLEMEHKGEKIPQPISLNTYSGKFVFRTTPEIHRQLVIDASEVGVSLNRYLNSMISLYKKETSI